MISSRFGKTGLTDRTISVSQGYVPFFVSATAGTTVYGAFDPLIAIADICKKYDVWMHVDVSRSVLLDLNELHACFIR